MYVVVHRDDTNNENVCKGVFRKRKNAIKCMNDFYEEMKTKLGEDFESDTRGEDYWGINYAGAYFDTCDIFKVANPKD